MVVSQLPAMLYVTDENGPRRTLMEAFNTQGFRITIAGTSEDALSLLHDSDTEAAIFNADNAHHMLKQERLAALLLRQFEAFDDIDLIAGRVDYDLEQVMRETAIRLAPATSDPDSITAYISLGDRTFPANPQTTGGSQINHTLRDNQLAVGQIVLSHEANTYVFSDNDQRFLRQVGRCLDRRISARTPDTNSDSHTVINPHSDIRRLHALNILHETMQAYDTAFEVARATMTELHHHVDFQQASLTLFDFEAGEALLINDAESESEGTRLPIEQVNDVLHKLRDRQPHNEPDMHMLESPDAAEQILIKRGIRSYTLFPLVDNNTVIGSLSLETAQPGPLPQNAVTLVKAVVEQLLIALNRTHHYKQITQKLTNLESEHATLARRVNDRTDELYAANHRLTKEIQVRQRAESAEHQQRVLAESLRDIATALNSSLDLDDVLDRILASIGRVLPFDAINVMLIEDNTMVRIARAHGYEDHAPDTPDLQHVFPLKDHTYLQVMHNTHMPLIITDTVGSAFWPPSPEQAWIRSYIGAPILANDLVIGFINVKSVADSYYQDFHLERLKMFTDQAAIAVRNAREHENAIKYATLEDRQRLARDLHDAVSQTLFSATVVAGTTLHSWARSPETVQPNLEQLNRLIRGALAEMRTLLLELRPSALQDTPLTDLVRQLAEAFSGRNRSTIGVEVYGDDTIAPPIKIELYRILQEALNNVSKHARAEHVRIVLTYKNKRVILRVSDDGRGFNPDTIDPKALGLNIMRERARQIGGQLTIETTPGEGTVLSIEWKQT